MDSHLKKFTEEKFITSYVDLIKETQNMVSKPMIFLMVPVSGCEQKYDLSAAQDKLNNEWILNSNECNAE